MSNLAASVQVTLVATGPLTNLAVAVQLAPNFHEKLKALYIMGGNTECMLFVTRFLNIHFICCILHFFACLCVCVCSQGQHLRVRRVQLCGRYRGCLHRVGPLHLPHLHRILGVQLQEQSAVGEAAKNNLRGFNPALLVLT